MRIGVWLIGARGSVATTVVAGAAAVRAGLAPATGCVTEGDDFAAAGLPALGDLVFGGHDLAETCLPKRAEQLARSGVLPERLPELIQDDLLAADAEIRPGAGAAGAGPRTQAEVAAALAADIGAFRERRAIDRVVVINVASTEPPCAPHPAHDSLPALAAALESAGPAAGAAAGVLPPSSLYAYAALSSGCAYVDFTPSTGARLPAIDELAHTRGVPYAGSDGKTGETLVRSVLAPMFARRALRVRSWSGTNLLGGGDGATLGDPAAAASKNASKQRVLGETLGYPIDGEVHIDYVGDLGDWKTAWDHILFDGFLGARMTLQFTWQGCDSALAAPLVLDLARLMARAHETGRSGAVSELAFFFKDPIGTTEHDLAAQYETLRTWAGAL
ncbi:MAG TPA: inositol-3-phosphate synthase [Streptosporangiaceae bacterium]|jgi:myo-inositol-1-phosphate synthase|nr:inositol-3-phosphate synthase [Streptosporangiaceae bacterium]